AVAHSSMALAPSIGVRSVRASPWSHGFALSPGLFEQSSSPQKPAPPSAGWCQVSIAPGFTLGSQSLQSPAFGVQPSLSMSAFLLVTLHVPPPELLPPDADASPKLPGVPPLL